MDNIKSTLIQYLREGATQAALKSIEKGAEEVATVAKSGAKKAAKGAKAAEKGAEEVATVAKSASQEAAAAAKEAAADTGAASKGAAGRSAKVLTPEQEALRDLKLADEFEAKGFPAQADKLRKEISAKYNFPPEVEDAAKIDKKIDQQYSKLEKELERAKKYGPESRVEKLNRDLLALSGGDKMDVLKLWIKQNPKKAIFLGLSATTLGLLGYKIVSGIAVPSPVPKPGPTPSPGPSSKKRDWKKCSDDDLKIGCAGDNVRVIQGYLIGLGYDMGKKGSDGKFGTTTESAVKKFQSDNGLSVTGTINKATLDKIESLRGKKATKISQTPEPETTSDKSDSSSSAETMQTTRDRNVDRLNAGVRTYSGPGKYLGIDDNLEESRRIRNDQIEKLVFERLVKGCK